MTEGPGYLPQQLEKVLLVTCGGASLLARRRPLAIHGVKPCFVRQRAQALAFLHDRRPAVRIKPTASFFQQQTKRPSAYARDSLFYQPISPARNDHPDVRVRHSKHLYKSRGIS